MKVSDLNIAQQIDLLATSEIPTFFLEEIKALLSAENEDDFTAAKKTIEETLKILECVIDI